MIAMTLPWPPSVNSYWRRCGNRYFIDKRGVLFRERVGEIITALILDGAWCPTDKTRLRLRMVLNAPTRRIFDLDNFAKAVNDSLMHAGLIPDDSQIDSLTIDRGEYRKNNGSCSVVLSEIG